MKFWNKGKYLSLVAIVPSVAFGAVCKRPVSVDGHLRLRTEMANDVAYGTAYSAGYADAHNAKQRTRMEFCSDRDASVVFEPQAYFNFGDAANSKTNAGSMEVADNGLAIHQAYVDTAITENFTFRGGRQILNYGDGLVVGADEWGSGRTFDALYFTYALSMGKIDFFYAKPLEAGVSSTRGDVNLMGIYTNWNLGDYAKDLDFYLMQERDRTVDATTGNSTYKSIPYDSTTGTGRELPETMMYGARLKSDVNNFDYRLELVFQNTDRKVSKNLSGNQYDLELGYTFTNFYNFRVGGEYFRADEEYLPFYESTNDIAGFTTMFSRSNLASFKLALSFMPMEDWMIGLAYMDFKRVKSGTNADYQARDAYGSMYNSASASDKLGSEWDLNVAYSVSAKSQIDFGLGLFAPGEYLKGYNPTADATTRSRYADTYKYAYLQYVVHF